MDKKAHRKLFEGKKSKEVVLKNGEKAKVFCPTAKDAQGLADHYNAIIFESENIAASASEGTKKAEDEVKWLEKFEGDNASCLFAVSVGGKIAGIAEVGQLSKRNRLKHRANFGISVQKAHWRKGIASVLMQNLIAYAEMTELEQIELEVVKTNKAAYSLYKKFGFVKTGETPHGLKNDDGTYSTLVFMVKTLQKNGGENE